MPRRRSWPTTWADSAKTGRSWPGGPPWPGEWRGGRDGTGGRPRPRPVILLVATLGCAAGMARLWQEQRQTLAALAKAESARASERQALLFTFAASDQITARALARLAESTKNFAGSRARSRILPQGTRLLRGNRCRL